MSTKDEYLATMKTQLDAWSVEIDALEAKAHEVRDDVKEKYQEQLSALRVKRVEGEKKLEEMREAGETAWEQVKVEADKFWAAFKDSVHTFHNHYKA
ncbi:hypothetical protein [uncultured Lamprocystis sp.]|jgi:chromosome segregation ATPase|uniref:hypothetical protein n=1 Tax=uncultured Lamprocystis sp. TaxID=543132 RepID=UPI0025E12E8A|nr:hypothetical protein [uncultured Lamprocystis sp.]